MRKILPLLLLLCIFAGAEYVFAQDIGNYQLIENRNVGALTNMNGSKELFGGSQREVASDVTSIGFDFIFMGKVYNTFSVNSNGVLRLGDEAVLPTANTYGIPGNDRIVPLAGWEIEYRQGRREFNWETWQYEYVYYWIPISGATGTSATGKVHYKITGNAPNKVLVVEWKEMEIPAGSGRSDITYQLRLHESTINSGGSSGNIEMVYDEGSMRDDLRNFRFRTGFGIGPEQGNFVAINHETRAMVEEQNFISGPVSGTISYFESITNDDKLLYRFATKDKPAGTFSNFELACPAPNAATIRFTEDCPNEAGIAVYRKAVNQPDNQFKFVASLPPDARTFSDGGVNPGQSFVYRFYLLSESHYADTYSEYTTEPIQAGVAFQAVTSGNWSNSATWGGQMPGGSNDVELGCAGSVFVTADADAQVRNLTIQKGSFLTIADGATLSVSGDFVNNGVFNPIGSGKLVLNGNSGQAITNNGKGITDDETFVSGTENKSWNSTGTVFQDIEVNDANFEAVKSVKVNIDRVFLRDVSIYLRTPNNQRYALAISRGQGGSVVDAVFSDTGIPLPPIIQNKNLTEEYRPEESFSSYSGPFNGTWRLEVVDAMEGEGGRLTGFELTLSKGGSNDLVMRNIAIDNSSSEGLTLNSGLVVQGNMELNQGIVRGSETETVLFEAGASSNEGNASSYIAAPVLKRGDSNFTFPIGSVTKWAPLSIENLRNADGTTTFKAVYSEEVPAAADQLEVGMDHISALEYWDLTPVQGIATLDLSLHWKDAAASEIINISSGDLIVAHYTNGTWVNEGGLVWNGSAIGSGGAGAVKAIDISTFSPFTFASQNGVNPLPVEMVSFTGSVQEEGVLLQWETASEFNNSHFEIQQSADARNWRTIGRTEGKGTTHQLQKYTFLDAENEGGLAYYRLKQVDFDGAFEYSSLVQLTLMGPQASFSLYPNPATDKVRIRDATYPAEASVINPQGVTVWKATLQGADEQLHLPNLANGVYTVQLRHSLGTAYERLVISK